MEEGENREEEVEDRREEQQEEEQGQEGDQQQQGPEEHREGDQDAEQGPEGQEARPLIAHDRPSQEEVDKHNIAHVPYRPWREHCVKGKADAAGHHRRRANREVPEISMDYMFLTGRGEEDEDDSGMPTIVLRDSETRIIRARLVPAKGAHAYAIKRIAKDLRLLGYNRYILKSDGEAAIVRLKEAVKAESAQHIICEESPVGDSQANGAIERAIKTV